MPVERRCKIAAYFYLHRIDRFVCQEAIDHNSSTFKSIDINISFYSGAVLLYNSKIVAIDGAQVTDFWWSLLAPMITFFIDDSKLVV